MRRIETTLGLTPILKRLAYSYLSKGFGRYKVEHPVYDEIGVEPLYDWQANPEDPADQGAGVKVVFYREKKRVRWVEFSVRFSGGGGNPTVFRVK